MDRSKKPKSNSASQRRYELHDMNKSSSSLNKSTSSLQSVGEETKKGSMGVQSGRRATTVRFASAPLAASASASTEASSGTVTQSQQAMARPVTASGARPGSASGPRSRTSAGRLPEPGPKVMRRSWGWTGATETEAKDKGSGNAVAAKVVAKTHSRSSSVPRRSPPPEEKEKPIPKRGSKIVSTPLMETNPGTPPKTEMQRSRSPLKIARNNMNALNSVSLKNIDTVSPRRRTSVTTIGAAWESLPSDLKNLGLEVMGYRDDAEAAAVEALKEASAAEILLRCLSSFADLTSVAVELSPQQTVDDFLALHMALTSSTSAVCNDGKEEDHAEDWLRAAVSTDLARFCLYSAPLPRSGAASTTVPPELPQRGRPATAGEAGAKVSWLEAARRGLGEEMRAWFLGRVEQLLDGDVAGTLGQLKRVNDWLDAVGQGPGSEAVDRVRKKIYGYLLDHVESAVVALNGGVAASRRK